MTVGWEVETAKRGRRQLHERPHEIFLADGPLDPAADLVEKRSGLRVLLAIENGREGIEQRQQLLLCRPHRVVRLDNHRAERYPNGAEGQAGCPAKESDVMDLLELYRTTDALTLAFYGCALAALWCWVASLVTGNYSQVDRLWSILPVLYVFHFAAHGGFTDARLALMATLAVGWGTRLTYNYARKGGYRPGGEDYRWPELQAALGPVAFQVLNATFVAPFQNVLLLLLATPAYVASLSRGHPLNALDYAAATLFLAFFLGEAIADEQQWRFQTEKKKRQASGERSGKGFITTGLFRYSRHPNFFCEQGMWWSFYLFAVAASGHWVHWPIAGAAILTLLFQGSTTLTERITLRKYPDYADYQRTTSRMVPWPPKAG